MGERHVVRDAVLAYSRKGTASNGEKLLPRIFSSIEGELESLQRREETRKVRDASGKKKPCLLLMYKCELQAAAHSYIFILLDASSSLQALLSFLYPLPRTRLRCSANLSKDKIRENQGRNVLLSLYAACANKARTSDNYFL